MTTTNKQYKDCLAKIKLHDNLYEALKHFEQNARVNKKAIDIVKKLIYLKYIEYSNFHSPSFIINENTFPTWLKEYCKERMTIDLFEIKELHD